MSVGDLVMMGPTVSLQCGVSPKDFQGSSVCLAMDTLPVRTRVHSKTGASQILLLARLVSEIATCTRSSCLGRLPLPTGVR